MDDRLWNALVNRDAEAAKGGLYGVRTTRIYCRAGCPSRSPKRENVVLFASAVEAEGAGFRACKRCRPRDAAVPSSIGGPERRGRFSA